MPSLLRLHADVDSRVSSIRDAHPDWRCGKGCDTCCRQLARMPQLTATEWDLLQQGLAALAPEQRDELRRRVSVQPDPLSPVVCPLLDQANGACPVYAQRPVACRTYGFYVQHGVGLYCQEIRSDADRGALVDVVWGNQDAIDPSLAPLGETRALDEWFAQLGVID